MTRKKILAFIFLIFPGIELLLFFLNIIKKQYNISTINYFAGFLLFLLVSLYWKCNKIIFLVLYNTIFILLLCFQIFMNNINYINLIGFIVIDVILIINKTVSLSKRK